ncbi:tetratricopeptide repeat protein [Sphingomonas jatrophae]|uniref:Tetratricopeptide repeat-containing protein n=1 Tax=Sphingomonas jatrophae TaxID=1166337 RepID=A0A1I6LAY9_9SPHN|nr:tetratricopeptide repeat protein [Sphingomonas jatrophae]SFS00646.1 Tetratricopeptide repeat-containing protein [Sphingomonas jatrophae]
MRWADAAALLMLTLAAPAAAYPAELYPAYNMWKAGRPADAMPLAEAAIAANPADPWTRILAARVRLSLGDGIGAEAELDRAEAAGLPRALTNHLRAHALLLEGRPARALDAAFPEGVAPRFRGYAARMRGRALAAQGDLAGADAAYDEARARDPNDPEAWVDTATFRRATGDLRGSIAAADRAVALGPRNVAALIAKGEAARTQYGLRAALPWFERALEVDPRNIDALIARAATEGDLGQMRAMLATTRAVIRIDPRNGDAFYLQAVLAARAKRWVLARTLLDKAGDGVAERPSVMLLDGIVSLQSGNPEQAIAKLRRLVAMQPDNLKARRVLAAAAWNTGDAAAVIETLAPVADDPRADSYTLTLIGRALERTGDRARAAAYLDRAAMPADRGADLGREALTPERLATLRGAAARGGAGARIALVRALLRGERGTEALAEATMLRDADPGVPATHLLVGDALAALGRYREAAGSYRTAADIQFSEPVALRLIDALRRAGDGPGAQRALGLYLQQNPRSLAGHLLRADLLLAAGHWAEAAPLLERLRSRIGPRDAIVTGNLAWAYWELGRRDEALALGAQAYRLAPANAAVATGYGWLLHASGKDRARGIALMRQGSAQAPRDPWPHWRLALAYAAEGRRKEARAAAQAALSLPGFGQAGAARALLGRL